MLFRPYFQSASTAKEESARTKRNEVTKSETSSHKDVLDARTKKWDQKAHSDASIGLAPAAREGDNETEKEDDEAAVTPQKKRISRKVLFLSESENIAVEAIKAYLIRHMQTSIDVPWGVEECIVEHLPEMMAIAEDSSRWGRTAISATYAPRGVFSLGPPSFPRFRRVEGKGRRGRGVGDCSRLLSQRTGGADATDARVVHSLLPVIVKHIVAASKGRLEVNSSHAKRGFKRAPWKTLPNPRKRSEGKREK